MSEAYLFLDPPNGYLHVSQDEYDNAFVFEMGIEELVEAFHIKMTDANVRTLMAFLETKLR